MAVSEQQMQKWCETILAGHSAAPDITLADYIRSLSLDPRYRCSATDPKWGNIKGVGPLGPYDYSNVTCLLPEVQAHDGRIRPSIR